jgi:hypothetical protein
MVSALDRLAAFLFPVLLLNSHDFDGCTAVRTKVASGSPTKTRHCAYADRMFGFRRKKLCGSYCFLICTSLGRFGPKLSFIAF